MKRLALFLLTFHAVPLAAQRYDSTKVRTVVEDAKRGNWFLRVQHDSSLIEGRVTFLHDDTAASIGRQRFQFADITRIERRTREGNAAMPAGIGSGLLLGGLGMLFAAGFCEGDCNQSVVLGAAAGFGIGFAVGGLFGAAIHPGTVAWRPLWPDSLAAQDASARAAAPKLRSGSLVTAQIGMQVVGEPYSPALPSFFSLHISRDHERFEFTPLGFTMAAADGEAGFFAFEAGVNRRLFGALYAGGTAGLGADFDRAKPVISIKAGINEKDSPLRLEFRINGVIRDGLHPSGHVLVGYSMRPW
jgi:hypothetical protein